MTRTQLRIIEKQVKTLITIPYIKEVMNGVIEDVLNKYPDDTVMHAAYTVGDLKSIGGFYTIDWLLNDMISVAIGRAVRIIVSQHNINIEQNLQRLLPVLLSTNTIQSQALPIIKQSLINKYSNLPVNQQNLNSLTTKYNNLMQLPNTIH